MKTLRRLSYAAFAVAYTHLVFGAIVRISGSGLGCGENWPKCYGHWFPPVDRPDLIIEWTHRLIASILITTVAVLAAAAWRKRREPGVSGPGGVLRPAMTAVGVVLFAAVLGAVTVFLGNAPYATAAHWTVAMTLIAVLAVAGIRAGGLGGGRGTRDEGRVLGGTASVATAEGARRTARLATFAASLAFLTVILGGLTAKVPGGSVACRDFPLCGVNPAVDTQAVVIQGTHRVLAFTVLFYLIAMAFAVRARGNERRVVIAGRTALGFAVLQILVAGAMIGMHLPAVLRSLHEAVGVAVWVSTFVFAYLAGRVARVEGRGSSLVTELVTESDAVRIPTPAGASASAVIEAAPEVEVVEAWMAPAVELIPEPAVDAVALPLVEPVPEPPAEPIAEVEAPSTPEAPSAVDSAEPPVAAPDEGERAARPASRVPTMAVIVARGADIL